MPLPATHQPRRPYKLLTLGCLLLAIAAVHAYWPRSTDVLIPVFNGAGKYGYLNDKGQLVYPFQWEYAQRFGTASVAGVTIETAEGKRWGAINRQGHVVIPYVWSKGGGFLDSGYSSTMINQKWGLIDQHGTVVVPHEWDFIEPIRTKTGIDYLDSYGWVKVGRTTGNLRDRDADQIGWVDRQGKVVVPAEFNEAESFDEHGWANVKRGKESGWINRQGKWVMPPEWDACSGFDEQGWAVVYRNGQAGYVDRQGKVVLPLQWDHCWKFHPRGYAQVMKNKKYGLIDRTGKVIMPLEWERCWLDDDGMITDQKEGRVGRLDLQGKERIPLQFNQLHKVTGSDYWQAQRDFMGSYGLVDGSGKVVIDFRWDDITDIQDHDRTFFVCKGEAKFPFPDWVQESLIKIYARFGKAWQPSKLCHVYDAQAHLLWSSDDWLNYIDYYLTVAGICLLLLGLNRYRRYRKLLRGKMLYNAVEKAI